MLNLSSHSHEGRRRRRGRGCLQSCEPWLGLIYRSGPFQAADFMLEGGVVIGQPRAVLTLPAPALHQLMVIGPVDTWGCKHILLQVAVCSTRKTDPSTLHGDACLRRERLWSLHSCPTIVSSCAAQLMQACTSCRQEAHPWRRSVNHRRLLDGCICWSRTWGITWAIRSIGVSYGDLDYTCSAVVAFGRRGGAGACSMQRCRRGSRARPLLTVPTCSILEDLKPP